MLIIPGKDKQDTCLIIGWKKSQSIFHSKLAVGKGDIIIINQRGWVILFPLHRGPSSFLSDDFYGHL